MSQRFLLDASGDRPRVGLALWRARAWLAALLGVSCLAAPGCHSIPWQGPVPKSVATCRQFSQQGINAMERGDWERAESLLSQAVAACPVDSEARRSHAETLWHRGALKEAALEFEEARRVAVDDTQLAVRTGELYLAMGQVDRAQKLAEQTLDLDPRAAEAWVLRGRAREAAGNVRDALADYQRSLGYCPGNVEVEIRVAESYRQLRQPQRALATLQSLSNDFPPGEEPQQVLYLQGLALAALGRFGDSMECLAQANQRGKPSAEIYCALAEVQLLAGQPVEASATVGQALALEPNHPGSRALKARMDVTLASHVEPVYR